MILRGGLLTRGSIPESKGAVSLSGRHGISAVASTAAQQLL
jgi:hypothetical protein